MKGSCYIKTQSTTKDRRDSKMKSYSCQRSSDNLGKAARLNTNKRPIHNDSEQLYLHTCGNFHIFMTPTLLYF